MVTQRSRQESLADEKKREKKKKEKKFKKRHKQWLDENKDGKKVIPGWGPYESPEILMRKLGLTEEEKKKARRKNAELYQMKTKAKGGIIKKFKGGLMVKPKAAKRGY